MPSLHDVDAACASLQDLKRQLQRLASLGGAAPSLGLLTATADDCTDAVILCTDRADIRAVNSAAARLTGYSARELQSITVWDITHSASQADFDVLWREFLRAGRQRGIYTVRRRDGSSVDVAYCAEARTFGDLHISILRQAPSPTRL